MLTFITAIISFMFPGSELQLGRILDLSICGFPNLVHFADLTSFPID